MGKKNLSEIVTVDDISLQRIIQRAIHMQDKDKKNKIDGISRKTLYGIASEIGVHEKYVERAIREEKVYDTKKDDNILDLARILNLKDKNEGIESKKIRVHKALVKILKMAKRFKEKTYTPEEIEMIYKKNGIIINGLQIIKNGFDNDYSFSEVMDNQGHRKYRLSSGWD